MRWVRQIQTLFPCILCLVVTNMVLAEPTIKDVKLSVPSVPCLDRLEVSFSITGDFENPFDPRQVQVDGRFTRPDGKEVVMPGFLYADCRRNLGKDGREVVEKVGEPSWRVRFAPTAPGAWQVVVKVRDRAGEAASAPLRFEATPAKSRGYIRRAPGTSYFCYEDGTPFFPIGENIAWSGKRGTYDFDDWLPAAGKCGMNIARIWLQWNNNLSIEHKGTGAGRYDLANAWRMDHVLDLARQNGIRVLFTCDSPEPYQKEHYWLGKLTSKPWENCPHNVINGGPLKTPEEFYTTEAGWQLIRHRLRYIVARWGWDPNIFCWELWNELNCFPGWDKLVPEIAKWHVEMAGVVRGLDPTGRLVTTSFGNAEGHEDIWKLKELDFIQSHSYQGRDMAGLLPDIAQKMMAKYGRPHLFGEFGTALTPFMMANVFKTDREGVYLHNALWSVALSGDSGAPLTWWWDNWVHPNNLYRVFTPVVKFCDGIPWTTAGFKPLQATVAWSGPPKPRPPRDLVVDGGGWPPVAGTHVLDPDHPPTSIPGLSLQGVNHRDMQKPVTLEVKYAEPGSLILRVGRVWQLGVLEVKLDGKPVLREEFKPGPGAGPWAESGLDTRWNQWWAEYNKDITIEIPPGKHAVELFNSGRDSIAIERLTLPRYLRENIPNVRCIGLVGKNLALAWIQNADHVLASIMDKRPMLPAEGVKVTLAGVPAGECTVEWWDTENGTIMAPRRHERATAQGLTLDLPSLATDIAFKIRW